MPTSTTKKLYYGWNIVAVSFFVDFIAVGFFFYSYGVFFKALAVEFGGSRLDVAIGITLVNIVSAVIAPFLGKSLDTYPIRKVMLFGTVNLSFGFLALAFISTQWQLYLILATMIAVGSSAMGGLSTAKLVTNWFIKKRGRALGIATMGISLSGVVMPIVSAWIIESYGWRIGFMAFAAVTLIGVYPIVSRFVVTCPADLGMLPDSGLINIDTSSIADDDKQWHLKDAVTNRNFWLVVITFGLLFCCMGATLTHMVPRVTDMGFSLTMAAPILSFGAATGVIGKFVYGIITDSWSARLAIWTAIFSQFVGQIILLYAESYWQLALGASVFGFGMGGIVPIHG
ncbi:MAG: MFS family permease, partial [Gammaproteobacteria bacterium]